MNKPIKLHPLAEREIAKAHRFYRKISNSAARGFLDEVDAACVAISAAPERWAEHLYGTRRYLVDRYPYVVVYVEREALIRVIVVSHGHRRPGYWKWRLRS